MRRWFGALLAAAALAVPMVASAPAAALDDTVYVGSKVGYGGTGLFQIWSTTPPTGDADLWAYCIEHDVSARTGLEGSVGDFDSYLGANYLVDPVIQGKVLWVLANSYPALSLDAFGTAVGAPGISQNDAIEATQYAIWRYTDLDYDAAWNFETPDSGTAYWALLAGANANSGVKPAEVTASITAPSGRQTAGTLVGPFVVSTNQSTVSVSVTPAAVFTDADGNPVAVNDVVDGQALYLDQRDSATAGQATVTVTAQGSGATGSVISVPNAAGTIPTAEDHAQTIILVAPSTATTSGTAGVQWTAQAPAAAPSIGTSIFDVADGDRVLPWNGGTAVDTIAYRNLTPGTSYIVNGELVRKSDGSGTGITGSTAFVPAEADGFINVTLVVPDGFAGETLVAFERLSTAAGADAELVAVHEDIDDAAQTVTVEQRVVVPAGPGTGTPSTPVSAPGSPPQLAKTGSAPVEGLATLAFLGILAGAALTLTRRRA